jgi:predicted secreted protein
MELSCLYNVKELHSERKIVVNKSKKLFLIMVVAAGLVAVGAGAVIGMTNVNGTTHEHVVSEGEVIEIVLEENSSTGYRWIPIQTCKGKIEVLRDYYKEGKPLTGAPVKHVWVIKGLEKGTCELLFEYTRPWEENSSMESKIINIRIR